MLWFVSFALAYLLMTLSNKKTGNPFAFLGVAYVGFCFFLIGGVVLKALGIN